jgi:hypothetical protein
VKKVDDEIAIIQLANHKKAILVPTEMAITDMLLGK